MKTIVIRSMTPEDIPEVAAIERETFSLPWSEKGFLDALAQAENIFLVAENLSEVENLSEAEDASADENLLGDARAHENAAKTEIVGYIGMYVSFGEGEITNVAVRESARGKGTGVALVSAVQRLASEKEINRIVLEVRASNAPAIHVYEKMGFVKLGIRKDFYEFPREDADIMSWER